MTQDYADLAPSASAKFYGRILPILLFALLVVVIPFLGPSRTMYSLLNVMAINIVFALSYNMLLGRCGLLSFGHAVYYGLGGYCAVHAMTWIEAGTSPFWANFPVFGLPLVGFAGGALAGAIIGWPSCRRAGTPFAMISLGVAELIAAAGFMFLSFFGGEMGVSGDRMNGPALFGLSMGPVEDVYWFMAFWVVAGLVGMYAFTRTPLGKLSEATRDNPQRVQFIGYDPTRVRYLVFIAAGAFAGMAGGMSAVNYEIFTPEAVSLIPSGFVLIMAYVGGIGYFVGPILGAVLLTFMQSMLSDYTEAWLLYLGVLFISIVMFAPGGLAGIVFGLAHTARNGETGAVLKRWGGQAAGILLALAGLIVLVEVSTRWSNGYGEIFEPFGLHLTFTNPLTWVLIVVPFAAGVAILRRLSREEDPA